MTSDNDRDDERLTTNRRRLLDVLGVAGVAGLAGCSGLGGGNTTTPGTGSGTSPSGTQPQGTTTTTQSGGGSVTVSARTLAALPSGSCEQSAPGSQRTYDGSTRIESDTTLGTDADVVVIEQSLRVTGGTTLTVEPGSTLVFGQGATLQVAGTLDAAGSCSDPIALVGQQDRAGFWGGVAFGENGGGTLDHVLIENGGGENAGAVTVRSEGLVELMNTEIRGSPGAAVQANVRTNGSFAAFSANALTDNEGPAVRGSVTAAGGLDSGSTYANNGDGVIVRSSTVPGGEEVELSALGVPYTVAPRGRGSLRVEGRLTLAPGVSMQFGEDSLVSVTGQGVLSADASGGDPVTLGGIQETAGYWGGIRLDDVTSPDNILRNVELANAGGSDGQAVNITGESRVTIEDSTIQGSQNYGIRLGRNTQVQRIDGNTISDNGAEPVWTSAQTARVIGPDNTFSGNGESRIRVYAGEFDGHVIPEGEEHTWSNPGVPLFLDPARGGAFSVYGSLTLSKGLTLEMGQEQGVYVTGELMTDVTLDDLPDEYDISDPPEEFVTFRGEQETAGYWNTIAFDDTQSQNNSLLFTEILHGGGGGAPAATEQKDAAVQVLRGSFLQLRAASIRQITGFGLFAQRDNELQETNFIHFEETTAPVYIYADSVDKVGSTYGLENNESDLINVESPIDGIQRDLTWPNAGTPYRVRPSQVGNTLSINAEVTIQNNAELRFEQGVGVLVTREGELLVDGYGDPVEDPNTILRGMQPSPGYWQGIRYSETTKADNRITNTGIYHTGSAPWPDLVETEPKRAAVAATGAAEATVENCHIADFEGAAFAQAFTSNPLREDGVNATLTLSGNVVE